MKLEIIQVEHETTVAQLLQQKYGLNVNNYFVSVNGAVAKLTDKVKPTDQISAIPIVSGG